jgi:hypothetical protein
LNEQRGRRVAEEMAAFDGAGVARSAACSLRSYQPPWEDFAP